MSAPKHLWSGDWERESEDAARERAQQRVSATAAPLPPADPLPGGEAPSRRSPPRARPSRWAPLLSRVRRMSFTAEHVRLGLLALAVALLLAAGAYGLGRVVGEDSSGRPQSGQPAWLGVQLGVLPAGAVVVIGVTSGGPAAAAGLRAGDVITQIESRPVAAPVDVSEAVGALRAGDTVEIQALRGSSTYTTRVKLGARPSRSP